MSFVLVYYEMFKNQFCCGLVPKSVTNYLLEHNNYNIHPEHKTVYSHFVIKNKKILTAYLLICINKIQHNTGKKYQR